MRRSGSLLTFTIVGAYVFSTAYAVTVKGVFEVAKVNSAHFVAGAGDFTLVFRFFFAALSIVSLSVWFVSVRSGLKRGFATILVVLIGMSFLWSLDGLERFSADYEDANFQSLVESFTNESLLTKNDVLERLGVPLFASESVDSTAGPVTWLYSYMPSGGFGWRKRAVYFDRSGHVERVLSLDEP